METQPGRLIVDPPLPGARNMAIDQALLQTANETGQVTLRFYQWQAPTLSLGYFQTFESRRHHVPSLGCAIVRRTSGGGAILHHHELTYSLAIPSQNRWSTKNSELYEIVHRSIIELLVGLDIPADLYADVKSKMRNDEPAVELPFLCFLRRTGGDIVSGNHKIVGSAQRRGKNALLQHGSMVISRSEFAPEIEGISDITGIELDISGFIYGLTERLRNRLGIDFDATPLTAGEANAVLDWQHDRFGNDSWTSKR